MNATNASFQSYQNISAAKPTTVSPSRNTSPTVSDTACWTWPTSLVIRDINCPVVRRLKNAAD